MKKLQALFLISLLTALPLHAQTYHAGDNAASARHNRVEISVAAARSFVRLQDGGGHTQLPHQDGLSGRALFVLSPRFALGAEGTWFEKEKDISFVSSAKARRYGAAFKFTLTPNTQPNVYLLAGAGKTKREFTYNFSFSETSSTNYVSLAVGVEAELWHGIFVAAEGYEIYNVHAHCGKFFKTRHRLEPGLVVRAGVKF